MLTSTKFTAPTRSAQQRTPSLQQKATTSLFQSKVSSILKLYCFLKALVSPQCFIYFVSTELSITLELKISPNSTIYEGDHLNISCSAKNVHSSSEGYKLFLSQGTKLLRTGNSTINHNMVAVPKASKALTFDCRVVVRNVEKYSEKNISVIGKWTQER